MRVILRGVFALVIAAVPVVHWTRFVGEHESQSAPPISFADLGLSPQQQLPDGVWTLTAKGCSQPVFAATAGLVGSGLTGARHVLAYPGVLKTVFLGQTSDGFSAPGLAWRWMVAMIRHMVGLTSGHIPQSAVVLRLPHSCPQLDALNWSLLSPDD